MDRLLSEKDSLSNWTAMAQQTLWDACRVWDSANSPVVNWYGSQAVAALWSDSIKVKTFLPVLALRRLQAMLKTENAVWGDAWPGVGELTSAPARALPTDRSRR